MRRRMLVGVGVVARCARSSMAPERRAMPEQLLAAGASPEQLLVFPASLRLVKQL